MSIVEAAALLNRSPYQVVAMEAGHAYANAEASPLGELDRLAGRVGASIGAAINEQLIKPVRNWVFLDTYNGEGTTEQKVAALQPDLIVAEYATVGFRAHALVLESDPALQQEALDLVAAMMDADPSKRIIEPQRQRVLLHREGLPPYRLAERVKSGGDKGRLIKPTCSVLDAALSLRKLRGEAEGVVVNVLPTEFAPQQDITRKILEVAGYPDIPVMSVYFDPRVDSPLATVSYSGNIRV